MKLIAFDFETSGTLPEYALQPWRVASGDAWVTSLAVASEAGVKGKLNPPVEDMCELLQRAIDENARIVGWNVTFDISWLLAYGLEDLVFKCKWLDGMRLWRHYFIEPEYEMTRPNKKSYGLKSAVKEFMPRMLGYERDIDFHDTSPEARARLQKYNEDDTIATLFIANHLWDLLTPEQRRCALIEADCLPMVALANLRGMRVNTVATRELQARLAGDAADMLEKLAPHGVTEKVIRSPLQLAKLMFDEWKLPVLKENEGKKTGKISRSTDKEVLHELAFVDPRAADLRKYREALGNKTKFADAVLASVEYNGDGHTHPEAIVFGTYSARFTYSSKQGKNKGTRQTGFAIHQMKRDPAFKHGIIPPPGYTLMEFDAAGQEFKWMAIDSEDETMLGLCAPGQDAHSYMASKIYDTDYWSLMVFAGDEDKDAKTQRRLGKVANLCVAQGTMILTDRGPCSIEHIDLADRVWDGVEFVSHAGVSFSGLRRVMTYDGVTATPTHEVLVSGCWQRIEDAARHNWAIELALGAGWTHCTWATIRILGGVVRRAVSEVWCAICEGAMRLWCRTRREFKVFRDWSIHEVQSVQNSATTPQEGAFRGTDTCGSQFTKTGDCLVPTMSESTRQVIPQLWGAWDRMPFLDCGRGSKVHQGYSSSSDLQEARCRSRKQRWSLRAWQSALGYSKTKSSQSSMQPTYDIVNCGPRCRFSANGRIVHNSLQYRTSARKLCSVARVQYDIPMELPQAQFIHKTYQRTYPGVPTYWGRQIRQTRVTGYVETFAGRRVHVVGNWDGEFGWSMASTAINYRIQGTGADQKYLALSVIHMYLVSIGAYFAWDLHDGIYLYVPHNKVQHAAREIKYLLDNLPYEKAWNFKPPIPLPWDCKTGTSWGTLKEFDYD